jgi:hypothetical protein
MVEQKHNAWHPESLRRKRISINAAVLTVIILALGLLEHYSNHNDGLATASTKLHYLWTYGSTASKSTRIGIV